MKLGWKNGILVNIQLIFLLYVVVWVLWIINEPISWVTGIPKITDFILHPARLTSNFGEINKKIPGWYWYPLKRIVHFLVIPVVINYLAENSYEIPYQVMYPTVRIPTKRMRG